MIDDQVTTRTGGLPISHDQPKGSEPRARRRRDESGFVRWATCDGIYYWQDPSVSRNPSPFHFPFKVTLLTPGAPRSNAFW